MSNLQGFLSAVDWNSLFAAFFGAGFGAYIAYILGRKKDKDDKADKNFAALVRAQFLIVTQLNFISNIRQQHLDPYRDSSNKISDFQRFNFYAPDTSVDLGEISFLAELGDPGILLEINICQHNYFSALDALKQFNQLKEEILEKADHVDIESNQANVALTPLEVVRLTEYIDAVFNFVDNSENALSELVEEVGQTIKKHFPGKKPLKFKPMERAPDVSRS